MSVHLRAALRDCAHQIVERPATLVRAPAGSGKSTLLSSWLEVLRGQGVLTAWIDLGPIHEDPAVWLEELVEEVTAQLGDSELQFGVELAARLPNPGAPDGGRLAAGLIRALRRLDEPLVLFLDNFHRLPAGSAVDGLLARALEDPRTKLRVVAATRHAAPSAFARIRVDGKLLELGPDDLSLRADQIERVLEDFSVGLDEAALARLLATTKGWVSGIVLAARALANRPESAEGLLDRISRDEGLFEYVGAEILAGEPAPVVRLLEYAALLGPAEPQELAKLWGRLEAGPFPIEHALSHGLLQPASGRVAIHQLWVELLRDRLRMRLGEHALRTVVEQIAGQLEAIGHAERAVELCLDAGCHSLSAELVERHAIEWVERGRRQTVASWIEAVDAHAEETHEKPRPAVEVARAMLVGTRNARAAIEALGGAADVCRAARDPENEATALHNILILAMNENLPEHAIPAVRRLVVVPRLFTSPHTRSRAMHFAGIGAVFRGRFGLAMRMQDRVARRELRLADRGAVALVRCQLAIMAGAWTRAIDIADDFLGRPEARRHAAAYFTLRAMRAVCRGVLGLEVEGALAELSESTDAFREFGLAYAEAESATFGSRIELLRGRFDRARLGLERSVRIHDELGPSDTSANTRLLLAISLRALGESSAAMQQARASLAMAQHRHMDRRPWVAPLAACVIAELGDVDTASDAVERGRFSAPDLPGSEHAVQLALARIAGFAGDEAGVGAHLRLAARAARAAALVAPLPDVPAWLLDWADERAQQDAVVGAVPPRRVEVALPPGARAAAGPGLEIEGFGTFRVLRSGEPVPAKLWRGRIAQRLLQRLLIAQGRPISRELLCAEFWPDAEPRKARGSLRVALTRLRHALDDGEAERDAESDPSDHWLHVDGEQVEATRAALACWDVHRWLTTLGDLVQRDGATPGEPDRELIRHLLDFGGTVFPDTTDDWAVDFARSVATRFESAAEAAASRCEARGAHREQAELARKLVAHDGANEAVWCMLVRAELALGQVALARRSIEQAGEALERELGRGIGAELRALGET